MHGEKADHGLLDEDELFVVLRVAVNQSDIAIAVRLEEKPGHIHGQRESRVDHRLLPDLSKNNAISERLLTRPKSYDKTWEYES